MTAPRTIRCIRTLYFSATGTTEKAVRTLSEALAEALDIPVTHFCFTSHDKRNIPQCFGPDELLIAALPVYAGRVPNVLLPYLTHALHGTDTPAITLVLYGNRNFDDALLELNSILRGQGFLPFASAALIGEHAFSTVLAAGRPDAADLDQLAEFGRGAARRLSSSAPLSPVSVPGCDPPRPYYTPRDRAGNAVSILKVKPVTDAERCIHCGLCARLCPMGSIEPDNTDEVTGICIKCCACVKLCPEKVKYFTDEKYLYHQHELELGFARRAEPAFFLSPISPGGSE